MRLEIDKQIPVASGMAGGSADAAAALRLAAEASGIGDRRLLEDIAATLGADVASQIRGGLVLATGIGARLRPLNMSLAYTVVVVPIDAELSAGEVYAEADRLGLPRDQLDLARSLTRTQAALSSETILERLHNDLQDAARSLCPAIDQALESTLAAGADHALVSGSGPTVLGVFVGSGSPRARAPRLRLAGGRGQDPDPAAQPPDGPDQLRLIEAARSSVLKLGHNLTVTNGAATILIAGTCGLLAIVAFVWFIAWPTWNAYSTLWERLGAAFLSLYVLAALLLIGAAGGAAFAYYWDRIAA